MDRLSLGLPAMPQEGASRTLEIKPMERTTNEPLSLRTTPRCGARRRDGAPCQRPRSKGKTRCKLHGGAQGTGAPRGEANGRYRHGLLTAEAIEERRLLASLVKQLAVE